MKKIIILSYSLLFSLLFLSQESIGQWIQTNGPNGGGVNCFAVKGINLFAGTTGGVYVSTNTGANWHQVKNGLPGGCSATALLVSNSNLFAGLWGKGIFLSTDDGANWTEVNNGLTNLTLYDLSSTSDTILFAGTSDGVFRSTNNGGDWVWQSSGWPAFPDVRALTSNNEIIFAATWFSKIFRSTNDGANWTDVTNGLNGSFVALAIKDTITFVADYSGRVYRSTNNGNSWLQVSSGLTLGNPVRGFAVIGSNIFAATRAGIYLSSNNGDSWSLTINGLPSPLYLGKIGVNNTDLFVSSGYSLHCVYKSTDNGANWSDSDSGFIATDVSALIVKDSNIFAGASGTGIFRSTDNGEFWQEINNGVTDTRITSLAVNDSNIFMGTWGGGLFRSSDNGANWIPVNNGLSNNQILSLESYRGNIFAGTYGGGIYRSSDNGSSWTSLNNFPSGSVVFAITANQGYIFAGSFVASGVGGVFRSTDDGANWIQVNNGLTDSRISTLEFSGNNLFAGTLDAFGGGGSGVYRSTDYGASWTNVNNGLTNFSINKLYFVNETNIFAGTGEGGVGGVEDAGIFHSSDNGNTWVPVNTGLWNTVVSSFTVSGENLYVGVEGGGVWRRPLSEIILPTTFQLSVSVNNGWNMVSVPGINPDGQGVDTWWPGRDPAANVFKYLAGYIAVSSTIPTAGYWMKHSGNNIYNTGDEWPAGGIQIVAHTPFSASAGWNLIGCYENPTPTTGITTTPPGLIQGSIFGYSSGYTPEDTLKPGYGYWIKLSGAGQINLQSLLFRGTSKNDDVINKDWGKIIISDASGRGYTLYAVNSEVNLEKFDLPPVPPSGIFDVRFGSGRMAEDISEKIQTIEMSGIVYPLSIEAEGVNIRLSDETGNYINTHIKAGEKITINNTAIIKLVVSGEQITDKYDLEQNYPNPFNPSTNIQYTIGSKQFVSLKVYDVLGSEVAVLVNEEKPSGVYKVNFNADRLASGIYFYVLKAGEFISTKKLMFMK